MQLTEHQLRLKSLAILHDIAGWIVSERIRLLKQSLENYKSGFNPDQPRAPAGQSDGGQWTSGGGGGGSTRGIRNSDTPFLSNPPDDPPIEPVYPIENAIGLLAGGGAVGRGVRAIIGETTRTPATSHGQLRSNQRGISNAEIQKAIRSAERTGSVTTKIGKYGTPQNVYKGSNGTTVIVETSGRNAGKVITIYRH